MKRALLAGLGFLGAAALACGASASDGARLLFAGDVLLAREVAHEIELRKQSPWAGLALIRDADFAMANFEGAVGEAEGCAGMNPCFAVQPKLLRYLAEAGFKAVGVANNHAGDLGDPGRSATRTELEKLSIGALDFEHSPGFVRIKGRLVALVAISQVAGRDGHIDPVPSLDAERKLRLARTLADWVIVFIHWGSELKDWPQDAQRQTADWLIAHGTDVVIGHHPHVVIPPECIQGRPVFYSLGNHVFDQKYEITKTGMLADCRIAGDTLSCRPLTTRTPTGSSFPRLDTAQADDPRLSDCAVRAGPGLTVAGKRLQPWGDDRRLMTGPMVIEGSANGRPDWKMAGRDVLAMETGQLIPSHADVLVTLEQHHSPIDKEDSPRPYVYDVTDHGLVARWRGSALAWPLIDTRLVQGADGSAYLCALHRGDSFLQLDPGTRATRRMLYKWSGFGFSAAEDPIATQHCEAVYPRD